MEGFRRFRSLLAMAAASVLVLWWWYPDQLGVVNVKLNAITLGALLGFLVDRQVFPYARPGSMRFGPDDETALQATNRIAMLNAASLRRAVIVGMAMLAMALAL